MKIFKNLIIFFILVVFACFLSINSQSVEIRLLPDRLSADNVALDIPLFMLILMFTGIGLVIGIFLQYFRAYKGRKLVQKRLIQAENRVSENRYLRNISKSETDEILSLLK